MRRALTIQQEAGQIKTIEELTGVFESIASLKIARLRNKVVASKEFFDELWQTYSQLRIDPSTRIGQRSKSKDDGVVFVLVTGEGKLSGEIDDLIVENFLEAYTNPEAAVVVIGSHGLAKLKERGVAVNYQFPLPESDDHIGVTDIIEPISRYSRAVVFYQTYESLRTQKVANIELSSAIQDLSSDVDEADPDREVVSTKDYVFEPGINEIADYLESLMMGVALTQVIMESKLAQYASRFNAMSSAKRRAHELTTDLNNQYHRSKRNEGDERLKEVMKVIVNGGMA